MKHLTTVLIGLLFFIFPCLSRAQVSCGHEHLHNSLLESDSTYALRIKKNEKRIKQFLANGNQRSINGDYVLPIVVHVIYTDENADNNISDAQIESSIQRLNEQYSNADGNSFDTGIQFQLATMDDDCQPTTGILRVSGASVTNYTDHGIDIQYNDTDGIGAKMSDVLELSRWNSDQYINIYIVNEINNNNGGYGTQGFSWVPGNPDPYDGIVILYNTIGYDYDNCNCFELKSYTELNATLAHEMGHYLSLYHTFQGDSNGASCPSTADDEGDYVADTPAHKRISSTCPSGNNTCYASNHAYYDIDLVGYNVMGYASSQCRYELTEGQANRMIAAIETSRPGLIYSSGLQTASVNLTEATCAPQTSTGLGGEYGTGILFVKIGDMAAASGSTYADGGYLERPCFTSTLEVGETYAIEIETYGNYNEDVRVYIDWDNSGGMNSDELVFSDDNGSSFSGSFTVPHEAVTEEWLRARIITDHYSKNISSSCYSPQYGQVEDYPIYVEGLNPNISANTNSLSGFLTYNTMASDAQIFTITGTEVVNDLTISAEGTDFEISEDGTDYQNTVALSPSNLILNETNVYVRLKSGLTVGEKTGEVSISYPELNSINITLNGEVEEAPAERGNALYFDGTGNYLQTQLTVNPVAGNFTLECWINLDGENQNAQVIFDQTTDDRSAMFFLVGWRNRFMARFCNQWLYISPAALFEYDVWHHIALTWDGTKAEFYLDGISVGTTEIEVAETNAESLDLGCYDGNYSFFKGKMDELRIWETARTQNEILENMHLAAPVKTTSDVVYYQFNQSGTSQVSDYAGTSSASIIGGATFVESTANVGGTGAAESLNDIASLGEVEFADCNLEMDFSVLSDTCDFTVIYQNFSPNSIEGISTGDIYNLQTWTIHQSSGGAFSARITFHFSDGAFSDFNSSSYKLYHRNSTSDGAWKILVDGAEEVMSSAVSFDGLGVTGQFLVVKE